MTKPQPIVTAVVCTRNRASFLKKCLDSLLLQSAASDSYEILVVDNGSTDKTAELVQSYVAEGRVRAVFEPVAGLSRARNTGWRNAHGEVVGYIDDDAFAEPTWIASVLWVYRNVVPLPSWIGGPIALDWEVERAPWINEEMTVPLGYVYWGAEPRALTKQERLGGGNSAYPVALLQELSGFEERLGRGATTLLSGEETELQKRIEARGGYLYYHPGMIINHFVGKERVKPRWFYRRYYWGGVSDYFMAKTLAHCVKPGETAAEGGEESGLAEKVGRLMSHVLSATGLFFGKERTVWARVYVSYVVGYCAGSLLWLRSQRKGLTDAG